MSSNATGPDWIDPDDAPELSDEWFGKATLMVAGQPVDRGGRPRGSDKERATPDGQRLWTRADRIALGLTMVLVGLGTIAMVFNVVSWLAAALRS